MQIEEDDQKVLAGEYGETPAKMLEILIALGKVFGAERLIPVRSVQVSGASYKTIGEYGLEWLQGLDAHVVVPTIVNPVGMSRNRYQEMGIDSRFVEKQIEILHAYEKLGASLECTCTPYYLTITDYGDHLAWSESSAVSYANSVIGARTNREGGPSALAAGIIGKTPEYGLHLLENRAPQVAFKVDGLNSAEDTSLYGGLGFLAGKIAGNKIPLFSGIRPQKDSLKALGAAMAATGAVALYHIEGITPDARIFKYTNTELEEFTISREEILALYDNSPVEAVAIGCPHCSPDELIKISEILLQKKVIIPLFIFVAQGIIEKYSSVVRKIEMSGAKVYGDTCMVVSPMMERYKSVMVNSGKALAYIPNMCGALSRLGTLEDCISAACGEK